MLKIAMAQMEVIPGRPDLNTEKVLHMMTTAKKQEADLIIFPEMSVPGYLLGDTWEQNSFLHDCEDFGRDIIAATKSTELTVIFGNIAVDWDKKNNDGRVRKYNALFIAQDGKLIQPSSMPYPFIIKTLMPNYREFDDTRHFFSLQKLARELGTTPGKLLSPVSLKLKGKDYQVGCLLCEDGWSDNYEITPVAELTNKEKVDFLINISASPYTLGKNHRRNVVFSKQANENKAPLLYVNAIGLQNNGKTIYTFDGASTAYNAQGNVVAMTPAYEEKLTLLNLSELSILPALQEEELSDIAQIHRALRYGISHFLQNIHMERVVIGISGGIDSAVAAALYTEILGADKVLLVNMPSVYNSETTKGLSAQLAKNLGCHYMVVPIQHSVDHTIEQLENSPLILLKDDTKSHLKVSSFVAENIQARDRSARILAGAAAAFGGGFTCNANKAETTVGYSTLYGDQSGFLAALADLWKHQVYALAYYLNEEVFHKEAIPQGIIDIVPSAELSSAQNVDEGKGDPIKYPYHDYLFRSFVERWQKASPEDILLWYSEGRLAEELGCENGLVEKYFPTPAEFIADLERWWNLFTGMAVAKRIQAPPILAVSRRAYGFDHREAQNGSYYTRKYKELKAMLLHTK